MTTYLDSAAYLAHPWVILDKWGTVHRNNGRCGSVILATNQRRKIVAVTPLQARVYQLPPCLSPCFTAAEFEHAKAVSS